MDERDADKKAQDYTAMGHSVDLINGIISGDIDADRDAEERQDTVDRNVAHLEIMVAKDDWGSEDMTAANAAITAGQGYTAS
jgi:phosphate uptake regulator